MMAEELMALLRTAELPGPLVSSKAGLPNSCLQQTPLWWTPCRLSTVGDQQPPVDQSGKRRTGAEDARSSPERATGMLCFGEEALLDAAFRAAGA
jgi:hypothetical protein